MEENIEKSSDIKWRIRRLTPKETWRLMGFTDDDFNKAREAGVSSTQLYKQAGNSIVVNVLYHIFRELYIAMPYLFDDLKVSSYFSGIGAFESALDRLYENKDSENFMNPPQEQPELRGGGTTIQIGNLYGTKKEPNPSGGRVYLSSGLMRTLGNGHGMSQPIILE